MRIWLLSLFISLVFSRGSGVQLQPYVERSIQDLSVTNILLASDVEGNVHALNRMTGELVWSFNSEYPLVRTPSITDEKITWMVEPFEDGALYFFTDDSGLHKLPTSIKNLVLESPFALSGDSHVYTGARRTSLYRLDASTGALLGCYGDDSSHSSSFATAGSNVIVLGRTTYELSIHSANNTVWNVTYSSWGPNQVDMDLCLQNMHSSDGVFVAPFHDSSLLAVDTESGVAKWINKLPAVAVNVFDIYYGKNELFVLPHPLKPDRDSDSLKTYVGKTQNGSWVAMNGLNYPSLVRSAPPARFNSMGRRMESSDIVGVHGDSQQEKFPALIIPNLPNLPQNIERPPSTVLAIDPPPAAKSTFVKMAVRILENALTCAVFFVILYGLNKAGLVPPITQIMSKFGLFRRTQRAVDFAQAAASRENLVPNSKDVTIMEDNDENREKVTKVTILEPETTKAEVAENSAEEKPKKRKRGTRGGKKNKKLNNNESDLPSNSPLVLSDVVLGYGSHGTVVYKGTFENRPVAVKRMLIDFYNVASREVSLLQESDDHPNVIRYFCSQQSEKFLYIALELCTATLEDVVEKPNLHGKLLVQLDPIKCCYQIANGLKHLHSLKIVHRDLKPQNILVVPPKQIHTKSKPPEWVPARLLISDFGLCKKLEADQSSFRATTANAAGTSGWRAPELLIGEEVDEEESDETNKRLTRSIDIFSVGCVFYYILSSGGHPFGDRYLREGNIIKNEFSLDLLDCHPDALECKDLISQMLHVDPHMRPDIESVLKHPMFWDAAKKLDFLLRVSDRYEVERRDPPSERLLKFEKIAVNVVGERGWYSQFNSDFIDNLGKYRKYQPHKLMDLLRALRNKLHHFNDLPENLNKAMGPLPNGFYYYFASRFPNMLLVIYRHVERELQGEDIFRDFY